MFLLQPGLWYVVYHFLLLQPPTFGNDLATFLQRSVIDESVAVETQDHASDSAADLWKYKVPVFASPIVSPCVTLVSSSLQVFGQARPSWSC